jgi:hypothetical protein
MPDQKARAQAFWAEVFNEHDLSAACGFVAPGFVNRNARPGTPAPRHPGRTVSRHTRNAPFHCRTSHPRPDLRRDRPHH